MVLAISGLMVGFMVQANRSNNSAKCYETSKEQVKTISAAVERFARKNDKLPLPAARNIGVEDINYGREAAPAAITQFAAAVGTVSVGALPFQALGLPVAMASDCWGNKLTYMVTTELTDTTGFLNTSLVGNIELKSSTTVTVTNTIAYAIISHGEDQLGAVKNNYSGVSLGWCTAVAPSTMRNMNCRAAQAEVASGPLNNGKDAGANYFDDVVLASGRPQILDDATQGNLYCWGYNSNGQLGNGGTANSLVPVAVSLPTGVTSFSSVVINDGNTLSTCALANTGQVYCWGQNAGWTDFLGVGDNNDRSSPTPVLTPAGHTYSSIYKGYDYTCATKSDTKDLYCWGYENNGEFGTSTYTGLIGGPAGVPYWTYTTALFAQIPVPFTYTKIAGAGDNICGLGSDGKIYCWGGNPSDVRGNGGVTAADTTPQLITMPSGVTSFTDVDAEYVSACAIANTGRVYCWGDNYFGVLGNGVDDSNSNIPVLVPLPTGVDSFTSVKVGFAMSCGLANTGVVYCWGNAASYASSGYLGNGAAATQYSPTSVTMPVGVLFTSLDVTGEIACAIGDDSRTYCWGNNNVGQLGDGTTTDRLVPTAVSNTGSGASELNFKSIATGWGHACGIVHNNSNMWCWGKNDLSQLGDGTIVTATRPVRAALPTGVNHYKRMSHGYSHTCAIGDNGLMYCWGGNSDGQFGDGTTTNSDVPVATVLPAGVTTFTHVSAGTTGHTCALANTRRAYCWGANGFGELGNAWASSGAGSGDPVVLPGGVTGFTSISAGTYVSCALGDDEKAYCWGYGGNGQMGNGSTTADNNVPVEVNAPATGVTYKKIVVGGGSVCGIGSNGRAYCWGQNTDGQLGNGTNTDSTTPVAVTLPTGVKYFIDIDIEYSTVCALADNGRAYCWGDGSFGKLGNGANVDSNVPVAVTLPTGVTAFKSISVGYRNVCATGTNDVNYCWGRYDDGALGNDATADADVPVPVSSAGGVPNFSVMDSGGDFNCGLVLPKTNAYAWGHNNKGQLGDNTTTDRNVPTQLRSDIKMHNISMGSENACGIGSDGYAYCWGANSDTDGHYNDSSIASKTPTRVASGFVFSEIYPGFTWQGETCALTPFGEAYCWNPASPTPTLVGGGLAFDTLSVGYDTKCGLTAEGRGYCWGGNGEGTFGDGSTTDSATPTPVSGRLRFRTIKTNYTHTCGLTTAGDAYCWGSNSNDGITGRLGDGTSTDRLVPTAVVGGHKFQDIRLGVYRTVGLTTGGQLYWWGQGPTNELSPTLYSGEHVFTKLMMGEFNVCALKADNSLWCTGGNPEGQRGDGNPNPWPGNDFTQVTYSGSADLAFENPTSSNLLGTNNGAALTKSSNAVCSGNNDRGQLGDGTNINSLTLQSVKLPGDIKLRRISSGTYQSCGIGDNGMAYCWGSADFWNLGDNRNAHSNTPTMLELPVGVTSFIDIDVSWRGNGGWALANTGQLYTWGEYSQGGFTPVLVAPVAFPPGVTGFIDVSSGYGSVHAIGNNGRLYALGFNHHADFGNGTSGGFENGFWTETNMPAGVDSFTAVDAAQYYTCAIANTRQVYCWGRNDGCNVGDGICGPIVSVPTSPVMPSEVTGVREISTAGNTCAIADNGRPYCWGFGASWAPTLPAPVTMPAGVTSFSNINAGGDLTCALANTGKTYCWGFTTYGSAEYPDTPFIPNVFANGTTSDSATPVAAFEPYTNALSALGIGETHSCAISLPKTNTYCAGGNTYGQLGTGNRISSAISQPTLLPNGVKLRMVSTDHENASCGIGEDNQAYCWGTTGNASGYNILGNGGSSTSPAAFDIPVKVTLPAGTTGWTHIDMGRRHTCAIANTGSLYCWGENSNGRLGTNTFVWLHTREPDIEATKPAGVNYFTEVSAGYTNSCAIGDDGGAYCWGHNEFGKLGDGTTTDRDEPTAISPAAGVTAWSSISAGQFHSCAIGNNGRAYCWGEGDSGEFGNGASVNSSTPVAANLPAGVSAYTKVSAGQHFTCALGNNGRAYCWGMGWNGQLGHGANAQVNTPVAVSLPTGVTSFKDITAGQTGACAIGNNNRTYCWGYQTNGQFGDSTLTASNVPVPAHTLSTLNPITQISRGNSQSCAISYAKSNLHCAGSNISGNFATGSFSTDTALYNTASILPPGVTGYKYLTAGSQWEPYHTCAIANTNDLYCWGGNSHGQLAQGTGGTDNNSSVPLLVSVPAGARYFTEVSAGFGNATCALTDTGRVYCWAQVDIGDGWPHGQGAPVDPAIFPPGVTAYTNVSATNGSACAVGNDGVTYCWGNGGDGIRGDGTTSNASSPTAVTMPANTIFKEIIAGGNYHRCALTAQGKAYCWGNGGNGRLGNGGTADSSVPVAVTLPAGVNFFRQLALGDSHTCGIADNNRAYCWGQNGGHGGLGNGGGANSSVPVPVTLPTGVTGFHSISSRGSSFTCAVANDNQTYCWGFGGEQFGNGASNWSNPVPILSHAPSALTTPTIPLVSEGYSCALSNVPKTFCWGRNDFGQLGNGTSGADASRPVSVQLPAGVQWFTKVVSYQQHTCALGNNSRAYCWGDNTNGNLGDNSTTSSLSPIAVSMPPGVVFTDIATGYTHTCALGDNGSAYCWGNGTDGAIGDGANTTRLVPTAVTFPGGVTSFSRISSGAYYSCALGNDGQVYCWGDNANGNLGDNTTTDRNVPTLATLPGGVTSFIDLAVGYTHSCAIADTGGIYCWGDNDYGVIGNGSAVDSPVPTATTLPVGVTAFTSVSAGYRHTCALGNNARAYCWGEGDWGAMGNGTNNAANYDTPTLVNLPTGATSYKSVTASAAYSCGITNDRRTFCWGYNGVGALGDGSTTDRLVPTEVRKPDEISEFQSIASHTHTNCAIGVP